jgi:D-3-phosphoglycerate dehydrogenase
MEDPRRACFCDAIPVVRGTVVKSTVMSIKRIVYFERLHHPVVEEQLCARSDVLLQKLNRAAPAHELASALAAAHAYLIGSDRNEVPPGFCVDDALLGRMPQLLVVSTYGAGYDTVDVDACTHAGVVAVNQAGGNAQAVAEHIAAMMLCLAKRIMETDRYMRRQAGIRRVEFMGHGMQGKTLGIIGFGHVGTRTAQLCRAALDMRVIAYDPYVSGRRMAESGVEKVELEALLARADVVSVSCALNRETRGMIGAAQYARMPAHAIFISTARGGIHDEIALAEALRGGRLAAAGLDVWDPEPPAPEHPLLQLDNVLVSPHTAGVTHEARLNIGTISAQQLLDTLDGGRPPRLLNREVWPAYRRRFAETFGFLPRG